LVTFVCADCICGKCIKTVPRPSVRLSVLEAACTAAAKCVVAAKPCSSRHAGRVNSGPTVMRSNMLVLRATTKNQVRPIDRTGTSSKSQQRQDVCTFSRAYRTILSEYYQYIDELLLPRAQMLSSWVSVSNRKSRAYRMAPICLPVTMRTNFSCLIPSTPVHRSEYSTY